MKRYWTSFVKFSETGEDRERERNKREREREKQERDIETRERIVNRKHNTDRSNTKHHAYAFSISNVYYRFECLGNKNFGLFIHFLMIS